MMRKFLSMVLLGVAALSAVAQQKLTVTYVAKNAVRVRYAEPKAKNALPDWLYVKHDELKKADVTATIKGNTLTIRNKKGVIVFQATNHELTEGEATLTFNSPKDECLYGLGQFQDGYSNVRGLSRRLTQVNTQISIPMLLSSKGYGVLWNNYGLTEFNPCEKSVSLSKRAGTGSREIVDVTSTEGGKREVRERHIFEATIEIDEDGDYALLLDVGQKMARRHNLSIDGQPVIEMQNLWLPPTASKIVHLTKGTHHLSAELTKDDKPVVYYNKVKDETTFRSPASEAVDYTVFVGTPDEIIATYR
jgi:alpha-D-xyloside xylohydrolase